MNRPTFLKKYSYTVPSFAMQQAIPKIKQDDITAASYPSMNLEIDFVQGKMELEGNWKYLISANDEPVHPSTSDYREKVTIALDICASKVINLNDAGNESMVFMIEGNIADTDQLTYCSGFLLVDKICDIDSPQKNHWQISFYIYDALHEDCEVKFSFPIYFGAGNPADN